MSAPNNTQEVPAPNADWRGTSQVDPDPRAGLAKIAKLWRPKGTLMEVVAATLCRYAHRLIDRTTGRAFSADELATDENSPVKAALDLKSDIAQGIVSGSGGYELTSADGGKSVVRSGTPTFTQDGELAAGFRASVFSTANNATLGLRFQKQWTLTVQGTPTEDDTIEFDFDALNEVYTFKDSPSSGGDLPTSGGAATIGGAIADEINGDGLGSASEVFVAEHLGDGVIRLTSIASGPYAGLDVSLTGVAVAAVEGDTPVDVTVNGVVNGSGTITAGYEPCEILALSATNFIVWGNIGTVA